MNILISVINQKLYISSSLDNIVAGSQEFVKFKFNLSEEWDELITFAQFRQNNTAYNQYLDEDNCVYLPSEIGMGTCTLILYGSNNNTIATTNYLTLKIDENILVSDAQSTNISLSLYNQLVTRVDALAALNGQGALDLVTKTQELQKQINTKAEQSALTDEVNRAKRAEKANADAIALKANQSQVDELELQVTELVNNEVIREVIGEAVADEMAEYLASGQLTTLIIGDGTISKAKMDSGVTTSLDKADSAMQPSVYDTQNRKVDIFAYAEGQADKVGQNLQEVKNELADGYNLTETLRYSKIGDAIRGSVTLARTYMQALLADYKAFTIEIVDKLPLAGESQTFYLIPKTSGNGYDKYWYITDEIGNHTWDTFGGSSTVVVESLPEIGEADVDYILKTASGYLYYKYINGFWQVIAGSLAYIAAELPDKSKGDDYTDYYIVNKDNGAYTHYRWINGDFRIIGGDNYTKNEMNAVISAFNERIDTNATNVEELSDTLGNLQQEVRNLDVEGYTYYATYGDSTLDNGDVVSNVFSLWQRDESSGQESLVSQFVIAGGGGGNTVTTNLVVERVTSSPLIITPTNKAELQFNYSSTDADGETIDGTYTWKLGNNIIATGVCNHGLNTFDATEFVSVGTQKFVLTVVDEGGSVNVKSWTVQVVDVNITSAFSDKITYPANQAVNFTYTPYGAISKTIHFILDGVELEPVITSASGTLQSYTLPAQEHGAHLLECYITASINNVDIETEHIFKDIIWFDNNSDIPVIGCIYRSDYYGTVHSKQYNTTNIPYYVFDSATNSPIVSHTEDTELVSTQTLSSSANIWTYKTDEIGIHTLKIGCKNTSVSITMDIAELGIDVSPVTANLAFDFNPIGFSNTGEDKLWTDTNTGVNMTVSDNFDWTNGGYQLDDDGNQYFCIKAGTNAVINYHLFQRDAKLYGSEFKIIFKTTNVRDVDATFLSCQSDDIVVGLEMKAHAAYLKTSATGDAPLYIPYSEDDIVEMELNINPLNTEDPNATAVIMSYEDGVGFRPLIYDDSHRLHQYSSVPITIGSNDCDVHIYRIKAYSSSLSDADILANFIADSRDSDTMIARYERNDIYNENNAITPEFVASACPDLKIIKIDCPYFTQDKKEIIKNTTIECIHKNGDPILDNWKAINGAHSGQGTTSNEYGYAGRNLNVYMCFDGNYTNKNTTYDPDYITELTMGDGTKYPDGTGKVTLTRNSVPNALFNIKVNIASSENANNALLQKRFHEFLPYTTVAQRRDSKIKTTMEFANCVVFVRENNTDLSTHREFNDTDWHFYAIGNIGDSKDTDSTRANNPDDHNEFVVEISDNTKPNSIFPSGVTDENGNQVYPISESQWTTGNTAYDSLHNNWEETFEFRYEHADISDDERATNIQVWNEFYKWIVTSTNEEFVNELKDWTIEEASLYMYLFTERYTMVDNRAKNTFWHYSKVYISQEEADALGDTAKWYTIDDEAAAIRNGYRFDFWDYDNDTSLGINNSGEMTMPYGKEDTDYRAELSAFMGDKLPAVKDGDKYDEYYILNQKTEETDADTYTHYRFIDGAYITVGNTAYTFDEVNKIISVGDPNAGYIFNAAESTFFCRIRDLMYPQLQAMYLDRESVGAWSADGLISQFDTWQEMFCEELWKLDIERKYYRTYQGGTKRFLETMMNGRKRYHRRQWERDQEAYMGTKYVSAAVKTDQIMFRCNTPTEAVVTPNYDLHIVPYADMYLSVLYGNSVAPIQIRAKAGVEYKIQNPLSDKMDDTAILIYCSSKIQELNDLSGCYIHDNDFTKASKLQKLIIGNDTDGYSNSFLTELNIGNNALLQELNVENCPNLIGSVNLTSCGNLETFYAQGTAITGVIFAPNGKIAVAHLPNTVNNLTMRNLNYLTDLQLSYDNLESLTEENSVVDEYAIVCDAVDTLQTLRLTGIDWTGSKSLADTTLLNNILKLYDANLSGQVYISGYIRLQEISSYAKAWPDLKVTYNSDNLVPQHLIKYVNDDANNTLLYEMYVDQGAAIPNPYEEGWIDKPTKASDAQYTYEFSGWDNITGDVLSERTVTAVYSETVRTYTVTWYARDGVSLGSTIAEYGSDVVYTGVTPTNTSGETAYVYNVFAGWDKNTGFITEDVDVYAIWKRAELPQLPVEGSDVNILKDLNEAQIYAIAKSGKAEQYFASKDYTDVTLGHDFEFSNIHSEIIAQNLALDGTNAVDTEIKLFGDNDKTFTIAIDFNFIDTTRNNTLLSAGFIEDGAEGFRLRYNNSPEIQWGNIQKQFGYSTYRDIVVLRHIKGENVLRLYASNDGQAYSETVAFENLVRNKTTTTNGSLILGGTQFSDGGFGNFGKGMIHWCKIWYGDLGDTNCRQLAAWPHERLRMEYCGTQRYHLGGGSSQMCNASFISNTILADRVHCMNFERTNEGGWRDSDLRQFVNDRVYKAIPTVWQSMLQQVDIPSSAGLQSKSLVYSQDYIYIPAYVEITAAGMKEPYIDEGKIIEWFTSNTKRLKFSTMPTIPDCTYYNTTSDPTSVTTNILKTGDIWASGTISYMYLSNDELSQHGLIPTLISDNGEGGWLSAKYWWTRSPIDNQDYAYAVITNTGNAYESGANSYTVSTVTNAICPCFSI